ncbi:MAG: hypothetical protein ACI9KE_001171 [Polyangiales bacterium]|jgi:hypothetical protein
MLGAISFFAFLGIVWRATIWLQADRRLKRRLRSFPLAARISDTPENREVRVSGALAYVEGRVIVEHGDRNAWTEILRDDESIDFILHDQSGRAHVDGSFLSLELHDDAQSKTRIFSGASPELREFCAKRGVTTKIGLFGCVKAPSWSGKQSPFVGRGASKVM